MMAPTKYIENRINIPNIIIQLIFIKYRCSLLINILQYLRKSIL